MPFWGGLPFLCLVVMVPVWEREGWVGGEGKSCLQQISF